MTTRECFHATWPVNVTDCLHIGDEWVARCIDPKTGRWFAISSLTCDARMNDLRGPRCRATRKTTWPALVLALQEGRLRAYMDGLLP